MTKRPILMFACLVSLGAVVSAAEIRRSGRPVPDQYIVVLQDDAAGDPNPSIGDSRPTVWALASDIKARFGIEEVKRV